MKRVWMSMGAAAGIAALAAVLSAGQIHADKEEETDYTKVGDEAPAFALTTLDGATITNENAKGKVLVINFFATWCGPCRAELPHLEKSYEAWQTNEHIQLVVAGREHTKDELVVFQKETGLKLPFAPDPGRAMYSKFAAKYIPRNYVIGADGRIAYQSMGFDEESFAEMVATVERLASELESGE